MSAAKKHEYPSEYPPGSHWSITRAWEILDTMPVGVLDTSQRAFLAGMISGALMKERGRKWPKERNEG